MPLPHTGLGSRRTGLDQTGRDLTANPNVRVTNVEVLGNGATILPYDVQRGTVLLSRQFRYPVYVNGHPDGMLIEAAAGLLDDDDPLTAIRREAGEELGVDSVRSRASSMSS